MIILPSLPLSSTLGDFFFMAAKGSTPPNMDTAPGGRLGLTSTGSASFGLTSTGSASSDGWLTGGFGLLPNRSSSDLGDPNKSSLGGGPLGLTDLTGLELPPNKSSSSSSSPNSGSRRYNISNIFCCCYMSECYQEHFSKIIISQGKPTNKWQTF